MPSLRSFLRAYLGIDLVLQRDSGLAARLAHIERQQTDLLRKLGIANDCLVRILVELDLKITDDPDLMVSTMTKERFLEGLSKLMYKDPHQ